MITDSLSILSVFAVIPIVFMIMYCCMWITESSEPNMATVMVITLFLAVTSVAGMTWRSAPTRVGAYWCAKHNGVKHTFPPDNTFVCNDGTRFTLNVNVTHRSTPRD